MSRGEQWFDDDAGPIVRPYAVTRGRTSAHRPDLQLDTLVAIHYPVDQAALRDLDDEPLELLQLCRRPVSIAELAGELVLPMSVVKIIVGDLLDRRLISARSLVAPDLQMIRAVINGIRRL